MNVEDTNKISEDEAKRIAFETMNRMCVRQTDVMIKYGDELLEICRIKHK